MRVEPLLASDLNEILQLEKELYKKPWQEKDYLYELNENPFAYYFKLVHEGEIIGYMGFWITFETAQITKVSISKKYQKRKISYILMQDMENRILSADCDVITLEVRVSNEPAIHLYKKCGFKVECIRENYYEDHEDAYLMIKELRQ